MMGEENNLMVNKVKTVRGLDIEAYLPDFTLRA
jgi:hypothetical protein